MFQKVVMVSQAPVVSEGEVSTLIFVRYVWSSYINQELIKKHFWIKVVTVKNMDGVVCLGYINYSLKEKYPLPFFVNYVLLITRQ